MKARPTRDSSERASPLSSYAKAGVYVLIAEPGAGKTTAFKVEAESQGGDVCYGPELSDLR